MPELSSSASHSSESNDPNSALALRTPHFVQPDISRIELVKPSELLGQATAPDGAVLKLVRRGDDYLILAGDAVLMSSRMHGSEETLAALACERAKALKRPHVLVGGLGMGFTLRAALDVLPADATVVVAELLGAVLEWNRGPLGPLAGYPLRADRVRIEISDVADTLNASAREFDAILLDVDNGPDGLTTSGNNALYNDHGIATAHTALKAHGVLALWAAKPDAKFEQRLRSAGFGVRVERVRVREGGRGGRHIVFLGYKP